MANKISRAKIVLASLGLVIAGGSLSPAARLTNSSLSESEAVARSLAGLPAKLPAGWRRASCSEILGDQALLLTHPVGETVSFIRHDARGKVADDLLRETISNLSLTAEKFGTRKVGGLEMVYAKGEGLWASSAGQRVKQMQGIIILPERGEYIGISSTNLRRQDYNLRSTETLLNSIKQIPV